MLETTAVVTAEHTLTIQLPPDIPPGNCRVVVVLENGKPSVLPWTKWKPRNTGLVDPTNTFRREDMIAEDGPAVTIELLRLVSTISSQGKQIHDANVIATMIAHGIPNLLTHNVGDFARFAGLITVLPLIPPPPTNPSAGPTPPPPTGAP